MDLLIKQKVLASEEIYEILQEEKDKTPVLKRQVSWKSSYQTSKNKTTESMSERKGSNSQIISIYTDNLFELSSVSHERLSLMRSPRLHTKIVLKRTFV